MKKKRKAADPFAQVYRYLGRLRAGGRSNMYGAIPYLVAEFGFERDVAFQLVCRWIDAQDEAASQPGSDPRLRVPERLAARPDPARSGEQLSMQLAASLAATPVIPTEPTVVHRPRKPKRPARESPPAKPSRGKASKARKASKSAKPAGRAGRAGRKQRPAKTRRAA